MHRVLALTALVLAGVVTWWFGRRLSPDAIAMAVGVVFGIMAGVPTSLILLAARHRNAPPVGESARVVERVVMLVDSRTGEVLDTQHQMTVDNEPMTAGKMLQLLA